MIIQKILFPTENKLDKELFFRTSAGVQINQDKQELVLNKYSRLSADTYFNSFSIAKWKKYTELNSYQLQLRLSGESVVTVFGSRAYNEEIRTEKIRSLNTEKEETQYNINIDCDNDILNVWFEIRAMAEKVTFFGGGFTTETTPSRNIKLAIDICTFHRYEYLEKNIVALKNDLISNPLSELYDKIDVFVVDNANDPHTRCLEDDRIHVFLQDQKGSTGGFTRGMLEIMKQQDFTHCVLMDDDVYLYPPVLERLYWFLLFLREEYDDALIGGALLRMDKPCIQHESGALWNDGTVQCCKHNYDLQKFEYVVKNEIEEKTQYMGWWFCCVPTIAIKKNGYPLPVYFHREDIEYGLRNPKQITLNGICTWHEPFEFKTGAVNAYYDVRNAGVVLALYRVKPYKYCLYILKNVMANLYMYRYNVADLMLSGVEDFLKGPDWILANDSGEHYRNLRKKDFTEYDLSSIPKEEIDKNYLTKLKPVQKWKRWIRYLLLNGNWIKSRKAIAVAVDDFDISLFWNTKCVYYCNEYTGKYFCCEKNRVLFVKNIQRMIRDMIKVICDYQAESDQWNTKKEFCTSEEFWWKILNQ